ncbi:hypothetical protein D3C72_2352650 [compost metagenome]
MDFSTSSSTSSMTSVVVMVRARLLSISSLRLLSSHSECRLAFSMALAAIEARLITTSRSFSSKGTSATGRST